MSTTSGQQLLLPESSQKHRKQRQVTVSINSRDRNLTKNPNSNNFRWKFRRPLKDIVSVELVTGCLPADLYTINIGWNQFTFAEASSVWQVTLTPGQYDSTSLAAELQTRLNDLGASNTYACSYSGITKKLTITATGGAQYSLLFSSGTPRDDIDLNTGAIMSINTPARLLGFQTSDYTSTTTIISPNRMDPQAFSRRLYIYLNVDSGIELHRVELGAGRRDCFHVAYLDDVKDGYYYLQKDTYSPVFVSFPAPLSRLSVLDVSIRDEFFRLVDLGNHDFNLVFEITYLD
jgi:hypothetical protein